MSSEKEKLAVVDETGLCQVVLLSSGEVIFQVNSNASIDLFIVSPFK